MPRCPVILQQFFCSNDGNLHTSETTSGTPCTLCNARAHARDICSNERERSKTQPTTTLFETCWLFRLQVSEFESHTRPYLRKGKGLLIRKRRRQHGQISHHMDRRACERVHKCHCCTSDGVLMLTSTLVTMAAAEHVVLCLAVRCRGCSCPAMCCFVVWRQRIGFFALGAWCFLQHLLQNLASILGA